MLHMYIHVMHACGNHSTALGIIPRLPYTLLVETEWLTGLELTKQARGSFCLWLLSTEFTRSCHRVILHDFGCGTQAFVLIS